jgi:hypothetical protein
LRHPKFATDRVKGGDGLWGIAPAQGRCLELPLKEIVRLEIPLISESRERYMRVCWEYLARAKALRSLNRHCGAGVIKR